MSIPGFWRRYTYIVSRDCNMSINVYLYGCAYSPQFYFRKRCTAIDFPRELDLYVSAANAGFRNRRNRIGNTSRITFRDRVQQHTVLRTYQLEKKRGRKILFHQDLRVDKYIFFYVTSMILFYILLLPGEAYPLRRYDLRERCRIILQ